MPVDVQTASVCGNNSWRTCGIFLTNPMKHRHLNSISIREREDGDVSKQSRFQRAQWLPMSSRCRTSQAHKCIYRRSEWGSEEQLLNGGAVQYGEHWDPLASCSLCSWFKVQCLNAHCFTCSGLRRLRLYAEHKTQHDKFIDRATCTLNVQWQIKGPLCRIQPSECPSLTLPSQACTRTYCPGYQVPIAYLQLLTFTLQLNKKYEPPFLFLFFSNLFSSTRLPLLPSSSSSL